MVFKRERHVLSYGERIVERCMLKQETHLLSDFAHPVKSQADDIPAMDANRSRVRLFEADDEPQQYALACAAASQHRQGFAAAYR